MDPITVKAEMPHPHRDHHTKVTDIHAALMSRLPRGYELDMDTVRFTVRRPYNTDPLGTWCVLIAEARAEGTKEKGE